MNRLFILLTFTGIVFGIDKLGKCEVNFNMCKYNCTVKHVFNERERENCIFKCKVEKFYCEGKENIKKFKDKVREMLGV